MPCYKPLHGFKSRRVNDSGKRSIVFNVDAGYRDLPVTLPCGRCIGCRLERSRQWALRCVHEAQLHEDNAFITLTYDDDHLPIGGSLVKPHFQKFMKRLRRSLPHRVRFYQCGEYGELGRRPHYHACLFGHDFSDRILWKLVNEVPLYTSETLQKLWGNGFATVGNVTFESAAYVARYIMKKVTGEPAAQHYENIDATTGEVHSLEPEYTTMSRGTGIGRDYYQQFKTDIFPSDFVISRGQKMKPPTYYANLFEIDNPQAHQAVKDTRRTFAHQHQSDSTRPRLDVRERCKLAQLDRLKRSL